MVKSRHSNTSISHISLKSQASNASLASEAQSPRKRKSVVEETDVVAIQNVVHTTENLQHAAQAACSRAFDQPGALVQLRETVVYANARGVSLCDEITSLREELARQGKELTQQREELTQQREELTRQREHAKKQDIYAEAGGQKLAGLENRIELSEATIEDLKAGNDDYVKIRQRFLDTFRRDAFKEETTALKASIKAGNEAAHWGDAVTDAKLFENGLRTDDRIIPRLYGMSHGQIILLHQAKDRASLGVLNTMCTMRAEVAARGARGQVSKISDEIETAFEQYCTVLDRSIGQDPRADHLSALGRAFYQFWEAHGRNKYL